MLWLQRWNFIQRARLERQLWDAFERAEDLEALIEKCRLQAQQGTDASAAFRLEIWQTTLGRIRKIEAMMKTGQPKADDGKSKADPGT